MDLKDIYASVISQAIALLAVSFVSTLHRILISRKLASQSTVRKVLHIITGFLYALTWPLYSDHPSARYLASLTPLAYAIRLIPTYLGWYPKDSLLGIMTRHNTAREVGGGPLAYALAHVLLTMLFWRNSAAGLAGIAVLCLGDGLAENIGVAFGRHKWWFNKRKSVEGSLGMLIGGFVGALGLCSIFCSLGYFPCADNMVWVLALASVAATLVEVLPMDDWLVDNWTVALTGAVVCWIFEV